MRVARGPKRPDYLGDRDLDRLMMMFTALLCEVSALRERLDTHELLAASGQVATAEAIDAFEPLPGDLQRRAATREAMLARVFRVAMEELELARQADMNGPTVEDVI
ncbi:MAG: hypothetical protein V4521_05665 [Pseudomonadota bacterium]